jgi:hypothetical protein
VIAAIDAQLDTRRGTHNDTGEVFYEFTSGQLSGTWDHRILLQVKRERYESVPLPSGRTSTSLRPCEPFVHIEGSPHKAMLGHNVYGGPTGVKETASWLVDNIGRRLGVPLPSALAATCSRVDLAAVQQLRPDALDLLLGDLFTARFPRRGKPLGAPGESVASYGRTTSVKLYDKLAEFLRHDAKRLRGIIPPAQLLDLRNWASGLLRVETEIKAPKLRALHQGKLPQVHELNDALLTSVHETEVTRFLREGVRPMTTVRTSEEVKARLYQFYADKPATARTLLSTWIQFSALGEESTRRGMTRPTFYRHRQQLQAAGVSWHGSDVALRPAALLIPSDFVIGDHNGPYSLTAEHPRVAELLAPYRAVA